MHELSEYLTVAQAARIAPSKPSPNCVWRWCRRGVKSRSGERVKLRHVRIGGMIFTSRKWIEEFGLRLAKADAEHFDLDEQFLPIPRHRRYRHPHENQRQAHLDQVDRELQEAGI